MNGGRAVIELLSVQRKSAVLTPSKLPCMARMPSINLTAGCAHGCVYCYAQGYCGHPGHDKVVVYANLLEKLRDELSRRREPPAAVCFSSSSDLFQPVPEVLDLAFDVLDLLLRRRIGVVFLTKGRIPRRHMDLLTANAPWVRAQIGLVTLDRRLLRIFEPRTATPYVRLEQARTLVDAGIATQVRLDPILPGVTDDPDALHALCAALADVGIREIAASTLFLRPALAGILYNRLKRPKMFRRLAEAFEPRRWLRLKTDRGRVLTLSPARRRQTFDWLTAIARQYGITVRICGCKNPDLTAQTCHMAGPWSPPEIVERQLALFAP